MAEKKETTFVLVPHALVVFKRPRSMVWQCRYKVDARWQRESTKEYNLKKAKAAAHDLLVEASVSLTAVMEPPMFGVMEPQTVAKTIPRRGLNNGGFCLFFGDGFA
jgi:hypothetical protein